MVSWTESENDSALARLKQLLDRQGLPHRAAVGSSPDGLHSESSLAVWGLSSPGARRIGRRVGQLAIFGVWPTGATLLDCTPLVHLDGRTNLDLRGLGASDHDDRRAAGAWQKLRDGVAGAEAELADATVADTAWLSALALRCPELDALP